MKGSPSKPGSSAGQAHELAKLSLAFPFGPIDASGKLQQYNPRIAPENVAATCHKELGGLKAKSGDALRKIRGLRSALYWPKTETQKYYGIRSNLMIKAPCSQVIMLRRVTLYRVSQEA